MTKQERFEMYLYCATSFEASGRYADAVANLTTALLHTNNHEEIAHIRTWMTRLEPMRKIEQESKR